MRRTHTGEVQWRTVFCGRDPTLEQGKSVRSPPPEEEGAAETTAETIFPQVESVLPMMVTGE